MNIIKAEYLISSPSVDLCPKADRPEYAFIGRSNVGKSSLINMLCNNQKLAKTSANPGKTQLINHCIVTSTPAWKKGTIGNNWYLVDLPGYGYAKIAQTQRKKWEIMIAEYLCNRTNLLNTFILIDARHEPQKIDLEFVNQLGQWGIPFTLVFTKADKAKPLALQRHIKNFLDTMRQTWQFLPQLFITSAETRLGKEEVLKFIDGCNKEYGLNAGKD